MQSFIGFLGNFLLLALTFMTAESLTRKAFPKHIRFWNIWKKDVANSKRILGNTIAGYYVSVLSLVFILIFYFFTMRYLNWWNPASLSTDPNSLATYFPWLSAIANALQAGFLEECLFRAIPLAGAVLIGTKLGKKKLFLGIGLIVQALIFGAGHANYAAQPAYARVVELIIPSLYFAFLYLRFGLLTGILMHFAFDAILMSLPIWITSSKGIWVGRTFFIILFFIPLFIVIYRWFQSKKLVEIKEENLNLSWQPAPKKEKEKIVRITTQTTGFNKKSIKWILVAGIIGVLIWIGLSDFHNYYLPLKVSRKQAIETAKAELERQGIELTDDWEILAQTWDHATGVHRFIWQEGGKEVFEKFIGKYIVAASWKIRFLRFEGDVAERAEEYNIFIREDGKAYRFWHQLPEDQKGVSLEKEEAQEISYQVLKEIYEIDPLKLKELSAIPEKLPERRDWKFTYSDTINYTLQEGELRYSVEISGDIPTNIISFVYAPEEWVRNERNQKKPAETLGSFFNILLFLVYLLAVVIGIIQWTKKNFSTRIFLIFFFLLFIIQVILFINSWQTRIAWFSTSEPLSNQVFTTIFGFLLKTIFLSFVLAVIAGLISKWKLLEQAGLKDVFPALGWGAIIIGIATFAGLFAPSLEPFKPVIGSWGTSIPLLDSALNLFNRFIAETLLLMFIFTLSGKITKNWTQKKFIGILLPILIGIFFIGGKSLKIFTGANIAFWLINGILTGILLIFIYRNYARFSFSSIPVLMSVIYLFKILKNGLYFAYPAALPGSIVGIIIIVVFGIFWSKELGKLDST
ncbi:MAG: CPBP family intramembrane metalloprotease [Armatimonadetes bacterium]|nr:CPBP family intramembrane metalloprotease [Armatimonadota bacterium]